MKPEELMIGDWVSYNDKMSCKITALCKNRPVFDTLLGYQDYSVPYEKLKPIPLTPEILEKNGFELQRDKSELGTLDTYWLGSELGAFRIHRLNNGDYQFGLAKIRDVHELQHALRLCGIDKEITI